MAKAKSAETLTLEEVTDRLVSLEERLEVVEAIAKEQDSESISKIEAIEKRIDEIINTLRMG